MRRGLLVTVLCLAAGAAAVPALAAFDEDDRRAVEEARESDEFRVFWLGERFRSQELTHAGRGERKGQAFYSFTYGDCDASDGGCAPPYEVQVYPACTRNLASYDGLDPERRKPIRGAAVYEFGGGGFFERIEVYTGRTTVVIWAPTFAKARRVARHLEGINVELGREDRLGRPARGALRGELRC